jgi:hypothetical protein
MKKSSLLIFALSALAAKAQITPLSFAANASFVAGQIPIGIDHADFDGDGKQDIVVTNYYDYDHQRGTTVSVYKNQRTPGVLDGNTYAPKIDFTVAGSPQEVAAHDMDGDGKADLVVANYVNPGYISVLRNTVTNGSLDAAAFAPKMDFPITYYPSSISIGDVDGDGKPDVVTTTNNAVTIIRNTSTTGALSFDAAIDYDSGTNPQNPGTTNVQLGDLDGDGKLDMVVTNLYDDVISVFRNISTSGNVAFEARVNYATYDYPRDVTISDLDGDGKNDLVVVHQSEMEFSLYRNLGTNGSFTPASFAAPVVLNSGSGSYSVITADLDLDGKKEIILGRQNLGISVYKNNSTTGSFAFAGEVNYKYPYAGTTGGLIAVDYDGDGRPDLAGTNYDNSNGRFSVLRNAAPVVVLPDFTFSASDLKCAGATNGSITLNTIAGTGPFQYSIDGAVTFQSNNVFSGLANGTYTAVVKNAAGSSAVKSITLTQPPVLTVKTGNNAIVYYGYAPQACTTLEATANGGVSNYVYTWSNSATTATTTVCPTVSTDYTVTVTDGNGCTATSAPVSVCAVDIRCGNKGVTICHKTVVCSATGKTKNETLCVPASAVAAHLAHGDKLGACGTNGGCPSARSSESVDEPTTDGPSVIVYPNPFSSNATLEFRADASERTTVEIYTTQGVLVARVFDAVTEESDVYHANIDGSQWAKGLYLVKIESLKGVQNLKLIRTE